ncbi:MAG: hypothetical protein B6D68_00975 [spirochete symbiont of Stewartia floridana]|nr:MAG: hypothetical protein B6D68_00975 [spirochete symbiont of Stewartia floridana]
MINPAALIGAMIGFFIGSFVFRSYILGIVFSMLGSSIGSSIGVRTHRNRHGQSGGQGWFTGWSIGANDAPIFMENLFSMLGKLAAADGHVSPEEERQFRNVVINELRITSPISVSAAMEVFHRASNASTSISEYARRTASTFGNRPQLLEMMLLIMIRVCASVDGIHPEEDRLLRESASIFGYSDSAYDSIRSRYTFGGHSSAGSSYSSHRSGGNLDDAYKALDVAPNASEAEVRKAYRKKAAEFHPDKIAAKGLPKEFTEFANREFQEIQKAWERIREVRGF